MSPAERIDPADLRRLGARALASAGVPADHADAVAEVLVLADMFGIHTHGVERIPQYLDRVALGGIALAPEIAVEQVAPALVRVDGGNGMGPLVARVALDEVLSRARATGIAAAFMRHSNHFGPVIPYLHLAAEQGFAAVVASNATTTIAPWGGRQTLVGNNPIGWGMPNPDGDPVFLDMALSVAARAKIRQAANAGEPIPDTWALDADGNPTTDPRAALDGFLQPMGGHKGYGLSVMIDLFAGMLSGAGYLDRIGSWSSSPSDPQDLGHVMILIDAGALLPREELAARMDDFQSRIHATPPADPARPVQLPGEREIAAFRRSAEHGIELEADVVDRLRALTGDA